MKRKSCAAVIVAAGSASRMQGIDKAVAPVGGVPVLLRTVRAMAASDRIDEIVVVTRADLLEAVHELCASEEKFRTAVCGGRTRAESVRRGLLAVETDLAAIHDGARPFVTPEIIDRTVEAAEVCGAAAPAIPARDTMKIACDGYVVTTPDRSTLFAVQTPQIFERTQILRALDEALRRGLPLTDDCSAMEALGASIVLTPGSDENIKITTPIDLLFAEAILKRRQTP